jgi:hypothetical protein
MRLGFEDLTTVALPRISSGTIEAASAASFVVRRPIALSRRQDQPARSAIGRARPRPIARGTWSRRNRERSRRAIDRPRARGPAPIVRVGTCSSKVRSGPVRLGIWRKPPDLRNDREGGPVNFPARCQALVWLLGSHLPQRGIELCRLLLVEGVACPPKKRWRKKATSTSGPLFSGPSVLSLKHVGGGCHACSKAGAHNDVIVGQLLSVWRGDEDYTDRAASDLRQSGEAHV